MSYIILLSQLFLFCNLGHPGSYMYPETDVTLQLYQECRLEKVLSYDIFKLAMTGMSRIDGLQNKNIITIVDFTKPSTRERLFVIDLGNKKILYKSLVAHGKNSGGNMASSFSNSPRSLKSSLGFYITGETYTGKWGYSLRLDGLEPGFNDNARRRSIVIHGADFVSFEVAKDCGLLGSSYGCPALPVNKAKPIIDKISNGTCLFIYGKDPRYLKNSKILNEELRILPAMISTQKDTIILPRLGS
jgi:hypothetical protein